MKIQSLKKGTTLIEVLVASLIMAIAIGALLMSYIPRRAIIDASKQNTVVQSLFEREFEKVNNLKTEDDLKIYLYESYPSKPFSSTNPVVIPINGIDYKLYYELYNNKPFKLVSLGTYKDSYLKPDSIGNKWLAAQVIEVRAYITWAGTSGKTESKNVIFRGKDAVDI